MRTVIDTLNRFAKENSFLALIALAIIGNIATDVFKKITFYFITNLATHVNQWSEKKIKTLIELYKEEIERVEKIKNKEVNELFVLLERLYDNLIFVFFVIVIYFLLSYILIFEYWFYVFIAAGWLPMFQTVANTYYNYSLMVKSRNFDSYKIKKMNQILRLQKLIQK